MINIIEIIKYINIHKHKLVTLEKCNNFIFNNLCGEKLYYLLEILPNLDIKKLLFSNNTCMLSSLICLFLINNIKNIKENIIFYSYVKNLMITNEIDINININSELYKILNMLKNLKDKRRIKCILLPFSIFNNELK
jgi:hypothetical protein